jgi:predicted metal-dependent hydrolase
MAHEGDAVLKGAMRDLGEASRRIRAARRLMREHELEDDPGYLRLVARLSEALEVTEAALREARRLRDTT